jgi:hypothetical protein
MRILDRYDSAVRTSHIESSPDPDETVCLSSDVLGAFGFAAHPSPIREDGSERRSSPLAIALTRLFTGDNHAAGTIVAILAHQAWERAAKLRIDLKRTQAHDISCAVLAWLRDGTCKACNGHGFDLIPGAPHLSGANCHRCKGTKKVPFDRQFPVEWRVLAAWLRAEVEREQSRAGPAAMAKLAAKM